MPRTLGTALATITDPADIATYADLFSQLEDLADTGAAARHTIAKIAADYQALGQ